MATIRKVMIGPKGHLKKEKCECGECQWTGKWEAMVFLGLNEKGKPIRPTKTFGPGKRAKKDAEAWAADQEVKRNGGTTTADGAVRARQTLSEFLLNDWMPTYTTTVRSTYTVETVARKWFTRVNEGVPYLGGVRLDALHTTQFQRLVTALDAQGMARRGIEQVFGLARRACRFAVAQKVLTNNPTDGVVLPKKDRAKEIETEADEDEEEAYEYLTEPDMLRVLAAASSHRLAALWYLLFDAGLRPSEATGLQWRHIDFDGKRVKVRGTLSVVRGAKRKELGRSWLFLKPKTKASSGDVPISDRTLWLLRKWQQTQAEERKALGEKWGKDAHDRAFVFTTEVGSPLTNNFQRQWAQVLRVADAGTGDFGTWSEAPKRAGQHGPQPFAPFAPKYSPYIGRHTCATLMALRGATLSEIKGRLRHKDDRISSKYYVHVKAADTIQTAQAFDRLLTRMA